jgi:DNA-binding MarR family transcriptional regulator
MHPGEPLTQREIATATHSDEGYTSKVVSRLEQDGLIIRDKTGAVQPRDLSLLLDTWREAYDFSKHHIIEGHIAARSGDALLRQMADSLSKASAEYAATGLAAAWLLDRFAAFRTTTVYLAEEPTAELLAVLSFREEERGANVWLVMPNDEGVFHGAAEVDGIRCVHPVQVYLDLAAHPERSFEASEKLRNTHLNWRPNV